MPRLDKRSSDKGEVTDTKYLVRFKPAELGIQFFTANRAEIQDEHLVFLNSKGELVALFLMEVVESWSDYRRHERSVS